MKDTEHAETPPGGLSDEGRAAPRPRGLTLDSLKDTLKKKGAVSFGPGDKDRTIPARLLEELARDQTLSVPVRINFAVITGDLDLRHTVFKQGFAVTESEFTGSVNFSFAAFERGANLTASHFRGKADFRAARVQKDFHLPLARFDRYACFEDLYVEEVFSAEGAVFGEVDFNRGSFSKSALFCGALTRDGRLVPTRFRGVADFSDVLFRGPTFFKGARFCRKAFFDGARTESVAFFSCDVPDDLRVKHKEHAVEREECRAGRRLARLARCGGGRRALLCTEFRGKATFIGTRFGNSVTFSGTRFRREADFRRSDIEGTALFSPYTQKDRDTFEPVSFGGDALFWSAQIKGAARFESARFCRGADFERVSIGGRAYFCQEREGGGDHPPVFFGGRVNFVDASIAGCAEFDGAWFKDEVSFERAQIGGCAFFRAVEHLGAVAPAVFGKQATFTSMTVKGSAEFGGAKFKAAVDFSRVLVEGRVLFNPYAAADCSRVERVRFGGEANFRDAVVKSSLQFDGAEFQADAVFKRLSADGNVLFRCAARARAADGSPEAAPTTFHRRAQFESVRVRGNAEFDGAHFVGTAVFERSEVGGNLYFRPWMTKANPARFRGRAVFVGLKVAGDAEFSGARFHSEADFTGLSVSGQTYFDARLHYNGKGAEAPAARRFKPVVFGGDVRFTGARFGNQVYFNKARFCRVADFTGARGESLISFEKAVFRAPAVFREARFSFMFFDRPSLKQKSLTERARKRLAARRRPRLARLREPAQFHGSVDLRGCTYDRIEVKLRLLVNKLVLEPDVACYREGYDRQPFSQLIRALRAVGDDRRADFVYLWQRRLERRKTWARAAADRRDGLWFKATRSVFNYSVDWFFWHAGNYGVQPERLFYISLAIILAGAFVFSRQDAVKTRETDLSVIALRKDFTAKGEEVSRFTTLEKIDKISFYPEAFKLSLSQFIPIIDISGGYRTVPSERPMFGPWFTFDMYASTHRLLGAVMVPLLLAAIATGLYRRVQSAL